MDFFFPRSWLFDASPNAGSTIPKRIEFADPKLSPKKMRREKSEKLSRSPATPTGWEDIQHFLPRNVGRIDVVRRHENDFVSMLLKFFHWPM